MNPTRSRTHLLLVAKAAVPGEVKTRLGRDLGMSEAAEVAAAALLDTIEVCSATFPGRCHLALAGSLSRSSHATALEAALAGWDVFAQEGDGLGDRLAHAHRRAGAAPLVQIGMDTPQVTGAQLLEAATTLEAGAAAVLGPAQDGGWWLLGLTDPRKAAVLADVPMSRADTGALTLAAISAAAGVPVILDTLRDVDTVADAVAVARLVPDRRFGRTWNRLTRVAS